MESKISKTSQLTIDIPPNAYNPLSSTSLELRFTKIAPLGYGGNGMVFSAIDTEHHRHVAVKRLSFTNTQSFKYALREIKITKKLQHENIVTVYDIFGFNEQNILHKHVQNVHSLYLVQELLDTDLHLVIQSQQLTEDHSKLFLYQILRGLKYIHSANVIHRDLKPNNILINTNDCMLKIADFGLARVVDPAYSHKGYLTENVGTCYYKSPELILSPADYSKAIDMWATGCIVAEMFIGQPLFQGANELDQMVLILDAIELQDKDWDAVMRVMPNKLLKNHPLYPRTPLIERCHELKKEGLDFIEQMLCFNPENRLSAEEALRHPYLTCYHYPQDEPVADIPFHIESEVLDDLSPRLLQKFILNESSSDFKCSNLDNNKCANTCSSEESLAKITLSPHRKFDCPKNKLEEDHAGEIDSNKSSDGEIEEDEKFKKEEILERLGSSKSVYENFEWQGSNQSLYDNLEITIESEQHLKTSNEAQKSEHNTSTSCSLKPSPILSQNARNVVNIPDFKDIINEAGLSFYIESEDSENMKELMQLSPKFDIILDQECSTVTPEKMLHQSSSHPDFRTSMPCITLQNHRDVSLKQTFKSELNIMTSGDKKFASVPATSIKYPEILEKTSCLSVINQKEDNFELSEKQKLKLEELEFLNSDKPTKCQSDKIQTEKNKRKNDQKCTNMDDMYRLPTDHLEKGNNKL